MCSCKRATELLSDAMHRKLSLGERVALRVHLVLCSACRRYRKQLALMTEALRKLGESAQHPPFQQPAPQLSPQQPAQQSSEHSAQDLALTTAARERIRNALNRQR